MVRIHPPDKSKQGRAYRFDKVLKQSSTQRQVFDEAGLGKMVRRVVQGYHSTIFAYGQTGSGKTFTMEGYKYAQNEKGVIVPRVGESNADTWGLVQRCAKVMVDEVERAKKHR